MCLCVYIASGCLNADKEAYLHVESTLLLASNSDQEINQSGKRESEWHICQPSFNVISLYINGWKKSRNDRKKGKYLSHHISNVSKSSFFPAHKARATRNGNKPVIMPINIIEKSSVWMWIFLSFCYAISVLLNDCVTLPAWNHQNTSNDKYLEKFTHKNQLIRKKK